MTKLREPKRLPRAGIRLVAVTVLSVVVSLASEALIAAQTCTKEAIQALAPGDAIIDSAKSTATPVPHCLVDGHIITQNPGPNTVNFRLQLPDKNWNGRYYFIGLGGAAGYVPTDSQIPSGNPMTTGFAVAGTDTGHQGDILDWSFIRTNRAQMIDHLHRGGHVAAVATQQITKKYYNKDRIYRYHSGCSGGGRMGMNAAIHHPEDFDGLLVGAPGGDSATMLLFMWISQQSMREPGAWLSPAKLDLLEQKVTAACDASDGALDEVVWDPAKCSFDASTLQCAAGDQPDCLSAAQVRTVKALLAGPRGPKGQQLFPGLPITNASGWKSFTGSVAPPWPRGTAPENRAKSSGAYIMGDVLSRAYLGPDFDFMKDFDFNDQKDIDAWMQGIQKTGFGIRHSPDLTGLEKSGNKLLLWSGVSDAGPVTEDLTKYYEEVRQHLGGDYERLRSFTRYYLIPGMLHCSGGTGPQDGPDRLLETLINWVEKGMVPQSVIVHRGNDQIKPLFASSEANPAVTLPSSVGALREFLLCPYPQRAVFKGTAAQNKSAVNQAANWTCSAPSWPRAATR
jgi:pimeloyl-ACP methyl ester carboxylesterase